MKRIVIPFIGLVACCLAMESSRPAAAALSSMRIPEVRSESAGGTVMLPAIISVGVTAKNDDEVSRAIARDKVRQGAAGTYIPEILMARDSALARWHTRIDKPVTVWVQHRPDLDDWNDDYVQSVNTAFMSWDAVDLPVRFRIVSDSAQAEVHVTWTDHFNEPISGRTRWSRDDNWWIVSASILLAVHHQGGEVLDKSAMKAMTLHEVGHLLGLDHTADATSIMAARVRVRDLSPIDRATVKLLYSVGAGTIRSDRP